MKFIIGVDLWTLFAKGGFFMWPILACALLATAIALERLFVLFLRIHVDGPQFMARLQRALLGGDVDGAVRLCNAEPRAVLPRVVKAALTRGHLADAELLRAVDEAVLEVTPEVNRRMGYLPMLANVSTLLGLLGTIAGLIQAFDAVANAAPTDKQRLLASGIAVAMYTTAGGLMVAVPSLGVHSLLLHRANRILDDVDHYSIRVLNLLAARRRGERAPEVATTPP